MTKTLASALVLGLLGLAGCPDIKTDPGEGGAGPTVQFDPAASIIPFPNNLVLDPTTGRVNLPQQCNEAIAQTVIRAGVLNTLDGFGTYESALQVTFSEAVDATTLAGHVLLFQRARGTSANDPATAKPIPVTLLLLGTIQLADKQFDEARKSYTKAAEMSPSVETLAGVLGAHALRPGKLHLEIAIAGLDRNRMVADAIFGDRLAVIGD